MLTREPARTVHEVITSPRMRIVLALLATIAMIFAAFCGPSMRPVAPGAFDKAQPLIENRSSFPATPGARVEASATLGDLSAMSQAGLLSSIKSVASKAVAVVVAPVKAVAAVVAAPVKAAVTAVAKPVVKAVAALPAAAVSVAKAVPAVVSSAVTKVIAPVVSNYVVAPLAKVTQSVVDLVPNNLVSAATAFAQAIETPLKTVAVVAAAVAVGVVVGVAVGLAAPLVAVGAGVALAVAATTGTVAAVGAAVYTAYQLYEPPTTQQAKPSSTAASSNSTVPSGASVSQVSTSTAKPGTTTPSVGDPIAAVSAGQTAPGTPIITSLPVITTATGCTQGSVFCSLLPGATVDSGTLQVCSDTGCLAAPVSISPNPHVGNAPSNATVAAPSSPAAVLPTPKSTTRPS